MSASGEVALPSIVLASRSPRRAAILEMLALPFEVEPARVVESGLEGEGADATTRRLAERKARVVAERRAGALVLGADTVVECDGVTLGKPEGTKDAAAMLTRLSGREHRVVTALALARDDEVRARVSSTDVTFRALGEEEIRDYVATGEPLDKAGAYGIQGLGSALVAGISGDYFCVMGLPVVRLIELLQDFGWRYRFGGTLRPAAGDHTDS